MPAKGFGQENHARRTGTRDGAPDAKRRIPKTQTWQPEGQKDIEKSTDRPSPDNPDIIDDEENGGPRVTVNLKTDVRDEPRDLEVETGNQTSTLAKEKRPKARRLTHHDNLEKFIKQKLPLRKIEEQPKLILGIDEAGRSNIFGPFTAAGVLTTEKGLEALDQMALIRDSKTMSHATLRLAVEEILKGQDKLWVAMSKVYSSGDIGAKNLNTVNMELFAAVVKHAMRISPHLSIYTDQVGHANQLKDFLKTFTNISQHNIEVHTKSKAENEWKVVAAASIVARNARETLTKEEKRPIIQALLEVLQTQGTNRKSYTITFETDLGEQRREKLKKINTSMGSGNIGDPKTDAWLKDMSQIIPYYPDFFRTQWKTFRIQEVDKEEEMRGIKKIKTVKVKHNKREEEEEKINSNLLDYHYYYLETSKLANNHFDYQTARRVAKITRAEAQVKKLQLQEKLERIRSPPPENYWQESEKSQTEESPFSEESSISPAFRRDSLQHESTSYLQLEEDLPVKKLKIEHSKEAFVPAFASKLPSHYHHQGFNTISSMIDFIEEQQASKACLKKKIKTEPEPSGGQENLDPSRNRPQGFQPSNSPKPQCPSRTSPSRKGEQPL